MNFEERLDRLTERHEALAQSVELFVISSRENWREQRESWSELRAQSLETEAKIQANTENIGKLIEASAALLHTAESHERRITGLEGGRA